MASRSAANSRLVAVLCCAWIGCAPDPTAVELTSLGAARVRDRFVPLPIEETAGATAIVQNGERLEVFLPLPERAVLRIPRVETAAPTALRVAVRTDGHEPRTASLSDGGVEIDLATWSGAVASVSFENDSGAPVRWVEPILTGHTVPGRLLLDASPLDPPPNVLLYVIDALRRDRLGVYAYDRATSPRLDRFAKDSAVFEAAYSPGPSTMDSVPSLFTGKHPAIANRWLFGRNVAEPNTLAQAFHQSGYATGGFQANFWMRREFGFGRGFRTYRAVLNEARNRPGSAAALHAAALEWIDRAGQPFFLYLQSMDVHNPYEPPAPFAGRFSDDAKAPGPSAAPPVTGGLDPERAAGHRKSLEDLHPERYDDAVAYADHELGALLDALEARGLLESTIVAITSDHGESLGEGGRYLHGTSLDEEQIRIPLLIRVPGSFGSRIEEVVSLTDLAPTLLDLAGAKPLASSAGQSLVEPRQRFAAVGRMRRSEFIRAAGFKLVVGPESVALYDLASDPAGSQDRSAELPVRTGFLLAQLWERSPSFRDRSEAAGLRPLLSPTQQLELDEALRALGYIE